MTSLERLLLPPLELLFIDGLALPVRLDVVPL